MLIGASLALMIILTLFSLVLGNELESGFASISVDNTAIVNGTTTTFVVSPENILIAIDITQIDGAIIILAITLLTIAGITGVQFLGSGLNSESSKIIILTTVYVAMWSLLSVLAYPLIVSIEIFGAIIYVSFTLMYVIGVVQKLSGAGG